MAVSRDVDKTTDPRGEALRDQPALHTQTGLWLPPNSPPSPVAEEQLTKHRGQGLSALDDVKLRPKFDPSERVREPAVFAFYRRTTAQVIADSTLAIIDFATLVSDLHKRVTTGGSWKFTSARNAAYAVSCGILLQPVTFNGAADTVDITLYKNGAAHALLDLRVGEVAALAQSMFLTGSCVVSLDPTDTIDVRLFQNSGGNVSTSAAAAHHSWITVHEVTRVDLYDAHRLLRSDSVYRPFRP